VSESGKKWAIMVSVSSLLAAGIGFMIYMKIEEVQQARVAVSTLETEISTARNTIAGTAALEREVIVLREVADVIEEILPDSEGVNNLIRTFHEYFGEAQVTATSYKRKPDTSRGRKTGAFDKVAYTLTLEGDIFQFMDLLDRLETHSRFMAVPGFKLTSTDRMQIEDDGFARHRIRLDVETYRYEPQSTSEATSIEAYDRKRDLLAGEINRRRQALTLAQYNYRGSRGRRDPWIDPRVPANATSESALSVQEQMDLVEDLRLRLIEAEAQWTAMENAENVLAVMIARRDLEEVLLKIEEELRRTEAAVLITYVPAQKRMKVDVYDHLDELRAKVTESTGVLGPSKEALEQIMAAMDRNLEAGEYELALDAFATIERSLPLVKGDPVRTALANQLQERAEDAEILHEFDQIDLDIGGVALIEGLNPSILINSRSLGIGDIISELEILEIRPSEIDFFFRGVILTRVF
jgi:Tfp pilus assembly protein PilO